MYLTEILLSTYNTTTKTFVKPNGPFVLNRDEIVNIRNGYINLLIISLTYMLATSAKSDGLMSSKFRQITQTILYFLHEHTLTALNYLSYTQNSA
jgi:hypothetical protein